VELYTHHSSMKNITANLVKYGLHLCAVHLVDAHYCSDPGKTSTTVNSLQIPVDAVHYKSVIYGEKTIYCNVTSLLSLKKETVYS